MVKVILLVNVILVVLIFNIDNVLLVEVGSYHYLKII